MTFTGNLRRVTQKTDDEGEKKKKVCEQVKTVWRASKVEEGCCRSVGPLAFVGR